LPRRLDDSVSQKRVRSRAESPSASRAGALAQSKARQKVEPPVDPAPDPRERIFLAAERLFAERGFDGVSVRDIVQAADVNLAAVSYYFGSKSELLLAVFRRRAKELNQERRTLLREAEARHGGAPPLAEILGALMGPPILWRDPASGKDTASRFISRALAEVTPDLRKILESDVSHLRGFLAALARALPDLSPLDVCWALHFTIGLPHQCTDTNFRRLKALSDGGCDTEDVASALDRAVRYAIGGIEAFAATSRDGKSAAKVS
jgi:AcrR family transcriptional regulator